MRTFRIFFYVIVLLLLILPDTSPGQNIGTLRGFLTDSLSGEVLPYGNIFIKELNEGSATDNKGYYLFPGLPAPGSYTVTASFVGYEAKEFEVRIHVNQATLLNIQLNPVSFELQTVEKIAQRKGGDEKPNIGVHTYTVKELEIIPQGVETDILRSIQDVPGVTNTSDITAKYYVRGGTNNQNLILLNDATIYNPFHALGMFSIVDPEMINSFDFYKGGFPTEYAGRTSSVLDLVAKYGNKNRFAGTAAVSLLTAKAAFEGPIPNGSFIITGRKSISDEVLKYFYNNHNIPVSFYDLSFNLNYADNTFINDARFFLHGFASGDKIVNDDPQKADYSWDNVIYGLSYYQVSDAPFFYKLSLNFSNFTGEVDPKQSNVKPKKNEVRDVTYKADFTFLFRNKDILDAGFKISSIKTDLFLKNSYGELQNIGPIGATVNGSIYVNYQMLRFENFGLEVGSRLNLVGLSKGAYNGNPFEPRLRLTYTVNPVVKVQAAAGVFIQELTTLSDEDEVITIFEPWLILPNYSGVTRSTHYTAGIDLYLNQNWNFNVEGYYKITRNVPLVNKNKIFPYDPDLVFAKSEAYGAEFSNRLSSSNISFTASYALAWVFNEIGGERYRPRYDIRNALKLLLEINLGDGWSFSTAWAYNSGYPFTRLTGYYDKLYFYVDPSDYSALDLYTRFALLDEKNTGTTPDYHRLDLNLSKRIELPHSKLFIGLNILNVYDRANLFYFNLETGERVNMLPFLPSIFVKAEF
jgi:Carboxypeptidase regulatory-like domain/TonB-dependent Receptor Plug Domain